MPASGNLDFPALLPRLRQQPTSGSAVLRVAFFAALEIGFAVVGLGGGGVVVAGSGSGGSGRAGLCGGGALFGGGFGFGGDLAVLQVELLDVFLVGRGLVAELGLAVGVYPFVDFGVGGAAGEEQGSDDGDAGDAAGGFVHGGPIVVRWDDSTPAGAGGGHCRAGAIR